MLTIKHKKDFEGPCVVLILISQSCNLIPIDCCVNKIYFQDKVWYLVNFILSPKRVFDSL